MAVPKKKRSRQIVRTRRSNDINKLLTKNNIIIKVYSNFSIIKPINEKNSDVCAFNVKTCALYHGSAAKTLCNGCYASDFVHGFVKNIH